MSKKLSEMTKDELENILLDLMGRHKLSKSETKLFYSADEELGRRLKQRVLNFSKES